MEEGFHNLVQGNYEEAESAYKKIATSSPQNVLALYELSWIYLFQQKFELAEETLLHAKNLAPDNTYLYYDLCKAYLLQQKFEQANQILRSLIAKDPENPLFYYQLGRIYALQDEPEKAQQLLEKVKEIIPDVDLDNNFKSQLFLTAVEDSRSDATREDPGDRTHADSELSSYTPPLKLGLEDMIFDDYLCKERMLGQGGMGEVYLVRHLEWDKEVAIKRCLRTDNPWVLKRFKRECLAWLSMEKHPNIVSAVHYTHWEGKPSLLIEYIQGKTLQHIIRNSRITLMVEKALSKLGTRPPLSQVISLLTFYGGREERVDIVEAWMIIVKDYSRLSAEEVHNILRELQILPESDVEKLLSGWNSLPEVTDCKRIGISDLLDYAIQICWAMAHAHKNNMLHRDLKPSNILVEAEKDGPGLLKVTDFGLVKIKGIVDGAISRDKKTRVISKKELSDSTALGTPKYMPPEQWESSNSASEKSDIYAFGMILYELFSRGQSPFNSHIEETEKDTHHWWLNISPQNDFYYWSMRHCSREPIPLSEKIKGLPKTIERVIMQCLSKETQERPSDFSSLALSFIVIYQKIIQKTFPRKQNVASDLMAIELNNRAVSLFEIGYWQKGKEFLDKALEISPNLSEVQLNQALFEFLSKQLSLKNFISKILNNFSYNSRDIMTLEVLVGVYFRSGVCLQLVQEHLGRLEEKFPRETKIKQLKGKCLYLAGQYEKAEVILGFLCSLENSRIEDWYHFIGCLYHQQKFDEVQSWMGRAAPRFKHHICFNEIKKILANPVDVEEERGWYEIEVLDNDYRQDCPMSFLQITPDSNYLFCCFAAENKNVISFYHTRQKKHHNYILAFPNKIEKEQTATLQDGSIAFLSTAGDVNVYNIQEQSSHNLVSDLKNSKNLQCGGGCLYAKEGFLVASHWIKIGDQNQTLLTFWRQDTWEKVRQFFLPGNVHHVQSQEEIFWFASESTLYTWHLGEKLGEGENYSQEKETSFHGLPAQEKGEIRGIYLLPTNKLIMLHQKTCSAASEVRDGVLGIYCWDIDKEASGNSTEPQIHKIEHFVLYLSALTLEKDKVTLLGEDSEDHTQKIHSWSFKDWKIEETQQLGNACYRRMEISTGNNFVFLDQEESFLDVPSEKPDQESWNSQAQRVYMKSNWVHTEKFEVEGAIRHFVTTPDDDYAFVVTKDQLIHVWKNVRQHPFPLKHKSSYLYIKPGSIFQDINLQKKIRALFNRAEQALHENDTARAMDYLRGVQNYQGYDWRATIDRIYGLANKNSWKKIGLRESLKSKRLPWSIPGVIISNNGQFVVDNKEQQVWDTTKGEKNDISKILNIEVAEENWSISADGRFIFLQDEESLSIYDLNTKSEIATLVNPGVKIEEALVSIEQKLILIKSQETNKIALLDLQSRKLITDLSDTTFSTLKNSSMVTLNRKVLLASRSKESFHCTLIQKDQKWESVEHQIKFVSDKNPEISLIANERYGVFSCSDSSSDDKCIHVFFLEENTLHSLEDEKFQKSWKKALSIAATSDGNYAFLGLPGGNISVWNTAGSVDKWRQATVISEHKKSIYNMVVSENGKFLMAADITGVIKIITIGKFSQDKFWKEGDWEAADTLKADSNVLEMKLSEKDRYLFAICEKSVHIWEFDWFWNIEEYRS